MLHKHPPFIFIERIYHIFCEKKREKPEKQDGLSLQIIEKRTDNWYNGKDVLIRVASRLSMLDRRVLKRRG